jgi:hypothetical protein
MKFFEQANEEQARKRCSHVAHALDVLRESHGLSVQDVGWVDAKNPQLVVIVGDRVDTHALEQELQCPSLKFEHVTFSFFCVEHWVSVWSGVQHHAL